MKEIPNAPTVAALGGARGMDRVAVADAAVFEDVGEFIACRPQAAPHIAST